MQLLEHTNSITVFFFSFLAIFVFSNLTTTALPPDSIPARANPTIPNSITDNFQTLMSSIPLDTLAAHANSYASANGIQIERRHDDFSSNFVCAPMSLLPNAYPRHAFQQALDVAPAFNELVDRVSRDAEFLQSTLGGGVSSMDPYTAKILQLYQQVYVNDINPSSPAKIADRLGIHRSDYMLHSAKPGEESYELKQVELNTIAASFAGLSCKIARLQQYLTSRFQS